MRGTFWTNLRALDRVCLTDAPSEVELHPSALCPRRHG
jgi:hypothetical protein